MHEVPTWMRAFFRNRVLLHVVFWLVVLVYFTLGYGEPGRYRIEVIRSAVFLPHHILVVYVFLYLLLPLLLRGKLLAFIGWGVPMIMIGMSFSRFLNVYVLGSVNLETHWNLGLSLRGQFTVLGSALAIKLFRHWYQQQREVMEARQQKLSAELQVLKSQVHPHFLFNTLNNLYSFTLNRPQQAPDIVLKLSQLLSFMIYESKSQVIPLSREIEILKSYIELEQLRYGDRLDISLSFTGDIRDKVIPPLLFLPLLENSFKHGTSKQLEQCWISLDMHVNGNILNLKLVNSKDNEANDAPETHGGLGLQNVHRRLALLYPGKFSFQAKSEDEMFYVHLEVELESCTANELAIEHKFPAHEMEMSVGR